MQLRRGVALLDAVLALALLGAWWALGLGVLRAQTLAQRLLAQRTEALWAATDLAARLQIHAGGSGLPTLPSAGGSAADCLAGTCTSAQLALAELMGWRTELDAVLPGAQVRLRLLSPGVWRLDLDWGEALWPQYASGAFAAHLHHVFTP